jgi:cytoskeletal protein CcmA (bactofilin family)
MEVQVKKVQLSPATSLLMALSLVMGILVSDSASISLFTTTAHAQATSGTGHRIGVTAGNQIKIADGTVLGGITLCNVLIGDQVISQGIISGDVQIGDSTVLSTDGVIVGDPLTANGVIVGDPLTVNGVIVGDPLSVSGAVVDNGGTATGGTLTGDNITVEDGVVTGQNLRLIGTTITGGSVDMGTGRGVRLNPAG